MRMSYMFSGLALASLTLVILYLATSGSQHPHYRQQLASSLLALTNDSRITLLTDGTFIFLLNRSVYEAHFPQLQHYQCRQLIARDALCQGPSRHPLLLLAIKSHPASGSRRATLRRTWARPVEVGGFRLQPLFLLAATLNEKQAELVARESRAFGDILMWDFTESHHNLSLKERCFLQWAHQHCQQAAYVFKGDDDLFVNPKVLTQYLRRTPNASQFIHGNIQIHSAVMRWGKYAVSRDFYPMDYYPTFASGGGFIMPRPVLAALYQASLELPVFPLDDVYLSFLTLAARIPHRHDRTFRVWGIPKDVLAVYQECVTVHGLSMERIEQIWKELESLPQGSKPHT